MCTYMEGNVLFGTECARRPCVLDDPEYREMKKRQEKNRIRNEKLAREEAEKRRNDPPPSFKRKTKTREQLIKEKIERLERESEEAYRNNRPRTGETKLHDAIVLRRKLRRGEN